ncbi:MAG: hypothetical protein K1X28_07435 [Parachlamydiales bacterium]|nr:hypothetical protein [Parachlamydiales bacterium]
MSGFQELFLQKLKGTLSNVLDLGSEAFASSMMDRFPIQDSFRFRTKYLGLRVAGLLLDEQGELNRGALQELVSLLDQGSFVLGPGREGDSLIYTHVRNCLRELLENKEVWIAIRRFSPPLCHKKAEELVRETLWPETIRTVQTPHIRKAVLASWLTLLRQTAGSCFATAPAILIQRGEPLRFFKDIYDLLSIGQMKRTVAGKEYSVPLSFSSGVGDLQRVVAGPFFGMVVALESVGVKLPAENSVWESGPQTVAVFLKKILLMDAGLTEEDLQDEEYLSRIQMTQLLARQGAVYYQRPSARGQKVSEWKKKYEKACITFKTITECALLRVWEYSMASFCDVKTEFARWNLYIGLGLHPDQKNGIGAFLYAEINDRLQKCHVEIDRLAKEYEQEIGTLQAIEAMIQNALGEHRLNQLKADWMSHTANANTIIEMRNKLILKAEGLTGFFAWLIENYDKKLQEYFQELFDPALVKDAAHLYDDSPAGFRLVYKHGRADASQWTAIYNREEYIDSLRDFFSRMENELDAPANVGKELFSEVTTALIQFIQGDEFFEWATARAKEKGRLSPWDYISGGTLQTLLMSYCNRDRPFTEAGVIPHSTEELVQFLATIQSKEPLLMHSPTHAFVFYPELLENRERLAQTQNRKWDETMQEHIAHRLSERLPEEEKALFIHLFRKQTAAPSNSLFRKGLMDALGPRIKNKEALVDSILYENSVLLTADQAQLAIMQILRALGKNEPVKKIEGSFWGSYDLYNHVKMVVLQYSQSAISSIDWDRQIAEAMRKLKFLPDALLFGDTNWAGWFFGFVQNPTTGAVELWRLNRTATQGFPMFDWKEWVGNENFSPWVVLAKPLEYTTN